MKRDQIENLFRSLACSQGSYGRLLESIHSADEETREEFWRTLEAQNFSDPVDVILFLEGC